MNIRYRFTLAFTAMIALAITVSAEEKKIKRSYLPAAVEKTVAAQSQGATIRGFSSETENGQIYYEVEMTVAGHTKDVLIAANGDIAEVEEQAPVDTLPSPVRDGLRAKAGKGKLLKVESITKHEKLVAYEAAVITAGKRSEVQVGPDGQSLDHEE
ncbi:MAG: hypothetical protein JWO91_424 [Acidobacteriaceae bacterium]|nr:hypothetical protein [Acidobacteriaceae bacterium]